MAKLMRAAGSAATPAEDAVATMALADYHRALDALLAAVATGSLAKTRAAVQTLVYEGFAAQQLIAQLLPRVALSEVLSDKQKSVVCHKMAVVDARLQEGADEQLQLNDLCATMVEVMG